MERASLRAIVAIAAAVALTACGSATDGAAPSAQTRTVVDTLGNRVRIPAKVTRVATNLPLIPPTMDLLGGQNTLVAAPSTPPTTLATQVAPLRTDVLRSPVSSVNADALLKAAPQVFIMTSLTKGLLPTLQRLTIPVVQIGGFKTPEDLQRAVTVVGDVLGGDAPARARQFVAYDNGILNQTRSATASLSAAQKPTVYYAPGPNATTTIGSGNIITPAIEAAGGRNIAAEHGIGASNGGTFAFPTVNVETLLAWNPQVVVAIDAKTANAFRSDPRLAGLAAVRDHKVLACPQGVFAWCASSSEAALVPLFLAKTLHPQQFPSVDLRSEVRRFYTMFYRHQLTDQQLDAILAGSGS